MNIGVSFCLEAVECKKQLPDLVKIIEAGSLANLESFAGDWTFHCRKEDPFDWGSPPLNLLKPDQIKLMLSDERMKRLLRSRPPKIVSFHLGSSAMNIKKVPPDDHNEAVSDIAPRKEIFITFCQSLKIIQESFLVRKLHLPIALENLDYHSGGAYEYICQPDFINEIFLENPDLYLLLDIAHAEISALALLKGDPKDRLAITKKYLQDLPLDRLIEIHINSPRFENNQALDMHLPITGVELEILEWLLSLDLPNFRVINLECEQKIAEQVRQLKTLKRGSS